MKPIKIALVISLLTQMIYIPCEAHEEMVQTDDKIHSSELQVGTYAVVTYYVYKKMSPVRIRTVKRKKMVQGFITHVDEDAFVIKGQQNRTKIKHKDVLEISTEATEKDLEDSTLIAEIHQGARVRIKAASYSKKQLTGTVLRRDRDTLVVQARSSKPVSIPLMSIEQLQVIQGKSRHFKKGATLGFMVGMLALLPAASIAESEAGANSGSIMLVGGLSGALAGGLLGAIINTPKWKDVPLDRLRISLAPTQHSGIYLTFSQVF